MGAKVNFASARRRALKKPSRDLKASGWCMRVRGKRTPEDRGAVVSLTPPVVRAVFVKIPCSKKKRRRRVEELDYEIECHQTSIDAMEKRLEKRRKELTRALRKRKKISDAIAS